ncbi:TPA: hypothetical protein N0F65_005315 [Lagenidium giganteum]|uniref:PA domain-containing protein n=1 Tax=Lagenidium giganteum TaxID=4803 RepID=A0AAV2YYC2_9STRA|nr:TPA: hypothetical protein N0F65_005315 [Lagenidium giganteum]
MTHAGRCALVVAATAAAALVQASVDQWPSTENDHTKLQIVLPESLMKKDGYQHKDALFGYPAYSVGSLQTQLIHANSTGCDKIDADAWEPPFALLLDRGECHFVEKVRQAQHAGARAVLIADNKCLCTDTDCLKSTGDDFCETVLPYMADDESGGDISIPSMLIRKSDADDIKKVIAHSSGVSNVMVKFDWGIPSPDGRVEWTLWQSAWDDQTVATLQELEDVVLALGERAYFTPRFVSYNGSKVGCYMEDAQDLGESCGNMCLNNGRYCLLDPSPYHDRDAGASGADVVTENLRRKCIWKLTSSDDEGIGKRWWQYVRDWSKECGQDENLFKEKKCAEKIMKKYDIDADAVDKCMQPYGVDVDKPNPLLEEELKEQTELQLLRLPALYVDGVHARGRIDATNVLSMICAGYGPHDPPEVCTCANQAPMGLLNCVKAGGVSYAASSLGGGYSFGSVLVIIMLVTGSVLMAGFVYYRRTQRQMREQVRSILAEYMPLEDQPLMGEEDLDHMDHPNMHPAEVASAKSPRGYLPTRGFLDEEDDGV